MSLFLGVVASFTLLTPVAADIFTVQKRLHKLGLGIPAWFINPNQPAQAGDGRPSTLIKETVSSMLILKIGKDGNAQTCDVLMTNGPADLAEGYWAKSLQTMRFKASVKPSEKAFWVHSHQDPASGQLNVEMTALTSKNN